MNNVYENNMRFLPFLKFLDRYKSLLISILIIVIITVIYFVASNQIQQTKNEIQKRLEQLRALDNNIEIMVVLAKSSPIGVDTKEDFLAIKKIMEYKS